MTTSMLAQEHIAYVNAVQYGDGTRTAPTVQAALNFIGSTFAVLLLTHTGNGVWILNASLVFPSNVIVLIPAGVTLAGSGNLTFNGQLRADTSAWYAGTGTLTFPPFPPASYFLGLVAGSLGLNIDPPQSQLHVSGDTPHPATIIVEQRTAGAGSAGLQFRSAGVVEGFFGLEAGGINRPQDVLLDLPGFGNFLIASQTGARVGLNTMVPQAHVHITGDASIPATLRLEEKTPSAGGATIAWWSAGTNRGYLGIAATTQDITMQLSNSARFIVSGGFEGIGIAPVHQLQLSTDDAFKPAGGSWGNSTSDARLKENVSVFTQGLAIALQLTPKNYAYNGLGETTRDGKQYVGFIAQDIETLLPFMVGHDTSRKLHPEDLAPTDFLTLNESALPYVLLNAIKEQQALIQALTDRVTALEAALP